MPTPDQLGGGRKVDGASGAPLSDAVAARVAFMYNQHDGYLQNNYPNSGTTAFTGGSPGFGAGADLGDDDTIAVRGSLLGELADAIGATLHYSIDSYLQCNELSVVAATVDQGSGVLD